MRRAIIFVASCAALILFVSFLSSFTSHKDPFDPVNATSFAASGVSQSTIAKMKLRHAAISPMPYDIGLFGNSRVLNVAVEDIDEPSCRIFNFAVGGESLRASTYLIEELVAINKVPRVVVVSIDHFELQMYNNPFFVSVWTRVQRFFSDLEAAMNAGASMQQIITVIWRAIWTQALAFQRMFEYAFLADTVTRAFGFESHPTDTTTVYVSDGSRRSTEKPTGTPPLLSPTTAQILPWQLHHDLKRIAQAKSSGTEAVIIYESPLHPTSAAQFTANPTAHAIRSRQTFQKACSELGLVCIPDALSEMTTASWSDASHPPASVLGPHISNLIAPYQSVCRP